MDERVKSVSGCRYVDEVIPNAPLAMDRQWIESHKIDLVLHGDDFSREMEQLCYKAPIELGIYRTVQYTAGISTTDIIARCQATEAD
jgi:glycerol-3-phosphate cytidylyltransferase-like family protein